MFTVEQLRVFPLENWIPVQRAVLCFIFEGDRVLLIEKKRGLGAGKVNGPGGKIDPGESALQAAQRETQEEIGITPLHPQSSGELFFQFTDGLSIHCEVFRSDAYEGHLVETDEALGFWCALQEIPYERMWQDDIYWFDHLIHRRYFRGYFTFDADLMLSQRIELL
ncbi:MAG: 8-oxo-dGTP diphosphatase [Candidatus Methylacidiphilales bacterium]